MGLFRPLLIISALVVASLVWEITALDRIIVALIVVLIIAWVWNRLSLTGIGFERTLHADRVNVGDRVTEEITLTNHALLPKLWIEVSDKSTLPFHKASRVVSVRGKRATTWEVETVAVRRGRYRLGPITLHAGDPFGMFSSDAELPVTHDLIVYPAKVDVSEIPIPTARLDGGPSAPRAAMPSSTSFRSIREYQSGDPMNRIAWRASAHRGDLMVKEFDPDPTADLWILLDLNDEGQFDLHHRESIPGAYRHLNSTVEYIVSIGATIAAKELDAGKKVGMILNRADPIRIEADISERQAMRIAETLAVVTSKGSRSIAESIAADHRRFNRNSGLIVITADPRQDWVAAGAMLVERLVPVTTVVVDAGGEGQDDITPLLYRLASAKIQTHRYPTHKAINLMSTAVP